MCDTITPQQFSKVITNHFSSIVCVKKQLHEVQKLERSQWNRPAVIPWRRCKQRYTTEQTSKKQPLTISIPQTSKAQDAVTTKLMGGVINELAYSKETNNKPIVLQSMMEQLKILVL